MTKTFGTMVYENYGFSFTFQIFDILFIFLVLNTVFDYHISFQSFRAVKGFLSKLEKVSENPELEAEMGKAKR